MRKRFLAIFLVALMLVSMLPVTAAAADEGVYKKISSMDELTTGKYVMILDTGYAPGSLDGTWVTAVQPSVTDGSVTDPTTGVWTLTVSGSSVKLTDANGVSIAPKGGNENGIKSGEYEWEVSFANGKFSFYGTGTDTVTFASNKSFENKFRAYKNTTINAGYPYEFTLYKLEGGSTEPEPGTVSIAEALAGEKDAEFTVKGVVTLLDGKNVYIQDSTGGICLYFNSTPSGISLGDTVIGTGKKAEFNGLPELANATLQKSSGMTLAPAAKTISELTTADICKYVKISGVEVTKVFDNNGSYSAPNITVKDDSGKTIQIYKAVVEKDNEGNWNIKVGDKLNVTAAVGVYNGTLQLRTTLESEIEVLGAVPEGPIKAGDEVVIYNPANKKALSTTYDGYYNNGTDVTINSNGTLSGVTTNDVWTVGVDAEGNYTFSTADGKKLSMGGSFSSMPLDDVNTGWTVTAAETDGCYYIKNAVRGNYIEWYADENNWSSYYKINNEALFAQKFWIVNDVEIPGPGGGGESGGLPAEGDEVMLYNISAKGVLAGQIGAADSPSIANALATVEDGKATAENGGVVFTVSIVDGWYRFKNEAYGYLCSNGTGNNAFYSQTASDDADWKLTSGKKGGFNLESRTAKFNNRYSQYLEYYSDSYKTYSMYNVTDYDIYEFFFYPCANGAADLTSGVVNKPTVTITGTDAYAGVPYEFTVEVNAVFGVGTLTVKVGDNELTKGENGVYTVPANLVTGEKITITVSGTDTKGKDISGSKEVAVKDEPVITEVSPAQGAETGDNKRPPISAKIENAGEDPTVTMTVNGQTVNAKYENGRVTYTPTADLTDGRVTVEVTVKRGDDKVGTKTWSFTVGEAQFAAYFGQLHSHTAEYSDGSGTLNEALDYVKGIPENDNVDFVAFTDHSNYFDSTSAPNPAEALYDTSKMTSASANKWAAYNNAIDNFNASSPDRIALAGYEMTWSGGPGHINTFNTQGIVSRNNKTLNDKTGDAGLQAYYSLLIEAGSKGVASINQLNHPGTTFGNFSDFAYYTPALDNYVQLVEVGNGEGQIGAGGYYPSYEQYIMALDKGWHVAPTNNQDNHKGSWGNANDARNVIYADSLTEDGLFDAIRERRLYATEDKNLEISYTLDGHMMGSQLGTEDVGENVDIAVTVYDPDYNDAISKVEVVVNSGRVAYTWDSIPASGELSATIPADYSYYFIRVTQADGNLAVTAPVWVGEVLKLGIDSVTSDTANPVTGEELTITASLFNSETTAATAKSVVFSVDGEVKYTAKDVSIAPNTRVGVPFKFTPDSARLQTVSVEATIEQGGNEYTFTGSIQIDVQDRSKLVYIGIDASHYNEYVNGNYKDSMGNFSSLAMQNGVRTVQLNTSEELIAACENESGKYKAIILTAPSRRDGSALRNPYATYSDAEIEAIKAFNSAGGAIVITGWGDYYESYSEFPAEDHMAAQQNKLLAALGSSLRVSDDEIKDDSYNGGQNQRLYLSSYNFESPLLEGVEYDANNPHDNKYTELFSHYGGASIHIVDASGDPTTTVPGTVTPVVYGFDTTYSSDDDKDGRGGNSIPKYAFDGADRLLVMATEKLDGKGLIVVSGAAFLSNFEVQMKADEVDSGAEKNYSNYKICENLVKYLNPDGLAISTIKQVQDEKNEGVRFTIEGVVTSNASGYDKNTAFFDCIYVQDGTAGINVFPVAGSYKLGDKVRITGHTSSYQGERQLSISLGSIEKIGETTPVQPTKITAAQLNDRSYLGSLVTLEGTVTDVNYANGLVQDILVKDAAGNIGRVFINGYITAGTDIQGLEVGCKISATGLASYDDTYSGDSSLYPRIRVRNRAEIICSEGGDEPDIPDIPLPPVTPTPTPTPELPFDDVKPGNWFYNDVVYVYEKGIMDGVDNRVFSPNTTLNRAMFVTMLYRVAGEPAVSKTADFSDVPGGTWFSDAVAWASSQGIVDGYDDDLFGPYNSLTREQLATILYRYAKWSGRSTYAPTDALAGFADAAEVSAYALDAMRWAVYTGLMQGSENGLEPQSSASRAQVAAIIHRFLDNK